QRAPADAEAVGGLLAAAGALAQRSDDASRLFLPELRGKPGGRLLRIVVEDEMRRVDVRAAVREHERALDHVVELTDVARPAVALERVRGVVVELRHRLPAAMPCEEALRERHDVRAPLAQRRNLER